MTKVIRHEFKKDNEYHVLIHLVSGMVLSLPPFTEEAEAEFLRDLRSRKTFIGAEDFLVNKNQIVLIDFNGKLHEG